MKKIRGKQILNGSIGQRSMKVLTESIIDNNSATNKQYVINRVNQSLSGLYQSKLNLNMIANNATVGELACDKSVIEFPLSPVMIKLNGILMSVGEDKDFYFSPDEGTTKRENGYALKGDKLHWNLSDYNLEDDDEIDMVYLVGYEYVEGGNGDTVELNPIYKSIVVKFNGGLSETMFVVINGSTVKVGNIGGSFVWDIDGDEHTFTEINESIVVTIDGEEYTIWFDGFGSLIFSVRKGNWKAEPVVPHIKYGLMYNWWAAQVQGGGIRVNANQWQYSGNGNNQINGLEDEPDSVTVNNILYTRVEPQELNEGEWYWTEAMITLAVNTGTINLTEQPDGYVRLNYTPEYSITNGDFRVPTDAEWVELRTYMDTYYNVAPNDFGVGNHLKSTRQINSPINPQTEHPRWEEHSIQYGRDTVGFNGLPGGYRTTSGFGDIGIDLCWWSSTGFNEMSAWFITMNYSDGNVYNNPTDKVTGLSIKVCRNATTLEKSVKLDGDSCGIYTGNDGKIYETIYIGQYNTTNAKVWIKDNLAETKWSNGNWIKGFDGGVYTPIGNAAWAALDNEAALCAYDDRPDLYM